MFTKAFFPNKLRENITKGIVDHISRCKIFKKNNPFADVFSIKLNNGARSVLASVQHPQYGKVLLMLKNFPEFQHQEYEQYINTVKPSSDIQFEKHVGYDIPHYEAPVADTQRKMPDGSKKRQPGKKGFHKQKVTIAAEQPDVDVEIRLSYRNENLKPSEAQIKLFETLIQTTNDVCVTGGAGAGKTLLAEKVLVELSPQSNQLVYLAPTRYLAREMLASMQNANVGNIVCLSLADIEGALNGRATFLDFFPTCTDEDYEKCCQLAVLQCARIKMGTAFTALQKHAERLNQYKTELSKRNRTDLNVSADGFPLGLLRATDCLVIDEFQQFPFPLLSEFSTLACRKIFLGDHNQATKATAQIALSYLQKLAQPYDLPTTFRVPSFVAKFANVVLARKSKKFNLRKGHLATDEQKAGNIYWCEQKILTGSAITVSINTAVVCLHSDDLSLAKTTFGESNVYRPDEILGLEFDNIIVILNTACLKEFISGEIVSKTEAVLAHSEALSLYSALYVVLTRTKQNLLLVIAHTTYAPGFFTEYHIQPTKLMQCSHVEEHFDNKNISLQTVIQYIDNEVKNDNVQRAEQLYYQHLPGSAPSFIEFCLTHDIDIALSLSPAVYQHAAIGKAKSLLMKQDFTPQDDHFFDRHQATLVACCDEQGIGFKLSQHFMSTDRLSGLAAMINNTQLSETTRANACAALAMRLNRVSLSDSTFLQSVLPSLVGILKNTSFTDATLSDACAALTCCLLRVTPSNPTSLNDVFPALTTIIERSTLYLQARACTTLGQCLHCFSPAVPSSLEKVLHLLGEVINKTTNAEDTRANACFALAKSLQHYNPKDLKWQNHIAPNLIDILNNSTYKEETRAEACEVLASGMWQVSDSKLVSPIKNVLASLIEMINKTTYQEATRNSACKALAQYLQQETPAPATLPSLQAVLASLVQILNDTAHHYSVHIQENACAAFSHGLKHAKITDPTFLRSALPGLLKMIHYTGFNIEYRANACSALTFCLQKVNVANPQFFKSVFPGLCQIINSTTVNEEYRSSACSALTQCLLQARADLKDSLSVKDIYPTLIEMINNPKYSNLTRTRACSSFFLCLQLTSPSDLPSVKGVLPGLKNIINGTNYSEILRMHACKVLHLYLSRRGPAAPTLLKDMLAGLTEMINLTTYREVARIEACDAFKVCLQQTSPSDQTLIKGALPGLMEMMSGTTYTEDYRVHAINAFNISLHQASSVDKTWLGSVLLSLREIINHPDYHESLKVLACDSLIICLQKNPPVDPTSLWKIHPGLMAFINCTDYKEEHRMHTCSALSLCLEKNFPADPSSLKNVLPALKMLSSRHSKKSTPNSAKHLLQKINKLLEQKT